MEEFSKPKKNQADESIAPTARIAGLQSGLPPVHDFRFSGVWGASRLVSKWRGYGNCFITEQSGFQRKTARCSTILKFVISGLWIYAWFASPRVRQRRGRLSPPSVVPAGSGPEAMGDPPLLEFPAASGNIFSHPLFRSAFRQE